MSTKEWDPRHAIAGFMSMPWKELVSRFTRRPKRSLVWRVHNRKYAPTSYGGAVRVTGRFNRGGDYDWPTRWPVLYLGTTPHVCLGELLRHYDPAKAVEQGSILSQLRVDLKSVIDLRDLQTLGVTANELLHDERYDRSHMLAKAVLDAGYEAMLVPSATGLGDNLIIFPDNLANHEHTNNTEQVVNSVTRVKHWELSKLRAVSQTNLDTALKQLLKAELEASPPVVTSIDERVVRIDKDLE